MKKMDVISHRVTKIRYMNECQKADVWPDIFPDIGSNGHGRSDSGIYSPHCGEIFDIKIKILIINIGNLQIKISTNNIVRTKRWPVTRFPITMTGSDECPYWRRWNYSQLNAIEPILLPHHQCIRHISMSAEIHVNDYWRNIILYKYCI